MSATFPSPPRPQRASVGAKLFLSVIGLVLAGAGAFFTYHMWQSYQLTAETYRWKETPCLIVESAVEEERVTLNSPVSYVPEIRYSYIEDDTSVIATSIKRVAGLKFKDKALAEELVQQYPAGRGAKCFVNPENPKDVILVRENKGALYSIWFPLLFVVGGLGMIINIWWPEGNEGADEGEPTAPTPVNAATPEPPAE